MRLSSILKTSILVFFFLYAFLLVAQEQAFIEGKISPYTTQFISLVKKSDTDSIQQSRMQARLGVKQIEEKNYISAFIELNEGADIGVFSDYDVELNMLVPGIATARIPIENIETVSLLPEVKRLEAGIPVYQRMDKARIASGVDKVQAGEGLEMPYKGKDVIVGIVDGGFEYGHLNFYDESGSEFRVKRVWNQNLGSRDKNPSGYSYGTEYKTTEEILEASVDTKVETHATHVAGIATGADRRDGNDYYGIATESDIVFVSYDFKVGIDNVRIAEGIKYIYDYASSVSKPCVVNLSLGMHVGPHDGTSIFDRTCDEMQGKGRLLVGAAGNEYEDKLHVSKSFSSRDKELNTFFNFQDEEDLYGIADIWGEDGKSFTIQVVVYNVQGKEIYTTSVFDASGYNYKEYSLKSSSNGAKGDIMILTLINSVNKRPNAFVVVDMESIDADNHVGIKITSEDGTVHAWAHSYSASFTGNNIAGWSSGNGNYSIGEVGGTGKRIISVGAYTTKDSLYNMENQSVNFGETLNEIATFSSRGPTMDGRIKPEITAPGTAVVSSLSADIHDDDYYSSLLVRKTFFEGKNYYYGALQGTSMASPHVVGILATWLQAKNNLTPEEVKYVLKLTSLSDTYTGEIPELGNNTWGYGKINAWEGLKKTIELDKQQKLGKEYGNIDVFVNNIAGRTLDIHFYTLDAPNAKLILFNMNGQRVAEKSVYIDDITQPAVVNVSEIPRGVYVLKIEGENLKYKNQKVIFY